MTKLPFLRIQRADTPITSTSVIVRTLLVCAVLAGCSHSPIRSDTDASHTASKARATAVAFSMSSIGNGLPRAGQWRSQLAVADMNGDGLQDLVLPAPRKGDGRPRVFLAQADGTWTRWAAMRQPAIRYDYGGVAVLDFNGDGRLDFVFGMHLRGVLAMVQRNAPGEFHDDSVGLNEAIDGARLMASSQSLSVLPRTGQAPPKIAVIYEPLNVRGAPGASIWEYRNQRWHRQDVQNASRGTHSIATARGVAYLTGSAIVQLEASAPSATARTLATLPPAAHGHAFAVSERGNGYVAVSEYRNDAWERRVDRLPGLLEANPSAPLTPLGTPIKRARGQAFGALAATSARPWNLTGEILAVGDEVGELQLFHVDGDHTFERVGSLPASEWRRRCPVSNLVWVPLVAGQLPRLIATFSGEISVYDFEGGCTSHGGIDVFAVTR